jgi:hypothetical protein
MSRETIEVYRCDVDGVDAVETVRFGLDGRVYEIELCAQHVAEFQDKVGRYASMGRPVAGAGRRRRGTRSRVAEPVPAKRARRPRSSGKQTPSQEVREWARSKGHRISDRGRIPRAVVEAYEASH